MTYLRYCLLPVLLGGSAFADTCPQAPDHADALTELISQVQAAENESDARVFGSQMWELWAKAPNEPAQAMLDRGVLKLRSYDYTGAVEDFDALIAYCPDFAEGYNQRAFVYYLQQDYAPALDDLDRTIALSPRHIAALAGRALTLMGLDRKDEARAALSYALTLNPWLSERNLMAPGGPLAPVGKDI